MSKDTRQRNDSQSNTCTRNASNNGDTQQQQENILRPPKKSAFIAGDSMIRKINDYLLTSSINNKYIVKVRPFVTAKADDKYDHKTNAKEFPVECLHFSCRYKWLTNRHDTRRDIRKVITFSKHLKAESNEIVASDIVPRWNAIAIHYHLNINLQLSLKNLKWKLRNGNVPAYLAKNFSQILGLLIRNMVSKMWICSVLLQFF